MDMLCEMISVMQDISLSLGRLFVTRIKICHAACSVALYSTYTRTRLLMIIKIDRAQALQVQNWLQISRNNYVYVKICLTWF